MCFLANGANFIDQLHVPITCPTLSPAASPDRAAASSGLLRSRTKSPAMANCQAGRVMQSCPCCKLPVANPAPQRFAAARSGRGSEQTSDAIKLVAASAARLPRSESPGIDVPLAPSCLRSFAAKAGVETAVHSSPPSSNAGLPGLDALRAINCTIRDPGTLTASNGSKEDVPGGNRPLQLNTGTCRCSSSALASSPRCFCSCSADSESDAPSVPIVRTACAARRAS
eukprot:scaffold260363_cov31-Tisochrysis_lutea.AAC.1